MANVSSVNSDDESANGATQSTKKAANAKPKTSTESGDDNKEDDEEDKEEEYEIEAIIDAKRGSFPQGRMGYFVKWKNYDSTENSWVDELDAQNAFDLIEDYWKKHPKKARKSDLKSPGKPAKPRKSDASNNTEGQTKKRGRKSQAAESEMGDKADGSETRATKKPRKSAAPREESAVPPSDEEIEFSDLKEYQDVANWESLVSAVDTIERQDDGTLMIYFSLTTGERARETSTVCRQRFPQKLLMFYEGNLRWKTAAEHEAES